MIFEVNTGAMSRGIRKTPYLGENLLYILRAVGVECVYELREGKFGKRPLNS